MDFFYIARITGFTLLQAACSSFIALIIGLPAAFFCGQRNFPGRKLLLSLSVIPFCVPSLIIALGYVTFLGINGTLNHFLMYIFGFSKPPVTFLYSFIGLVTAQGFLNFPIIMKNVSQGFETIPQENAESARLLGADEKRIFRTITIYQLFPSIGSSTLLVFIYCFLSFIFVLLFGGIGNTTLEIEIFKTCRTNTDFSQTGILCLIETTILCAVTFLYSLIEQKSERSKGLFLDHSNSRKKITGIKEATLFILLIILLFIFFFSPLLGIIYNAFTSSNKKITGFTLQNFKQIINNRNFLSSVLNTIKTGICTGFFCTIIGFIFSLILRFAEKSYHRKIQLFLKVLIMIPMCISSVAAGYLILRTVKSSSISTLIFLQTLLTWPLSYRIIFANLSKIQDSTIDSALLLSKNFIDFLKRVIIPLCSKSLITSFCFCFSVSAGDTTLPLVLSIPKFDTLSLFTYRYANSYRFNQACAAGIILTLICILSFGITNLTKINKIQKRKTDFSEV